MNAILIDWIGIVAWMSLLALPATTIERIIRPWPQWTVPVIIYPAYMAWVLLCASFIGLYWPSA